MAKAIVLILFGTSYEWMEQTNALDGAVEGKRA